MLGFFKQVIAHPALKLDGRALANALENSLTPRIAAFTEVAKRKPTLAILLVGEDPASRTYVKMKINKCEKLGIGVVHQYFSSSISQFSLTEAIHQLNRNTHVDGILLQYPLPKHLDASLCFDAIDLHKDVDGASSQSLGLLARGQAVHEPATPKGIMTLLHHYQIQIAGRSAVVLGRGPILGQPLKEMLINAHATVTVCHSKTPHEVLLGAIKNADLVFAAVGKPEFVKGSWIKRGAVIVDAGSHPQGKGDVTTQEILPYCSAYTPAVGGVGPMTIISLMQNTLSAAEHQFGLMEKPIRDGRSFSFS